MMSILSSITAFFAMLTLSHLCKLALVEPVHGTYHRSSSAGRLDRQAECVRAFKALSVGREMSSARAMRLGKRMRVVGVQLDARAGSPW